MHRGFGERLMRRKQFGDRLAAVGFRPTVILMALGSLWAAGPARADSFGSGANTFSIDFVTIGNPGNAVDTMGNPSPAGSVDKAYRIGTYEISEQMIDKANALGGLGITKDVRGADKPATRVSWNEAARFVNWLDTSTGSPPAYKFAFQPGDGDYNSNADIQLWTPSDAGYNPNNLYRNSLARYFLPSVDEWFKAAYYDPTSNVYYDFPTGSNSPPTAVASGTAADTAVFDQPFEQGPADITQAGGLSPYGTMGQGGNVWEWEETDYANDETPTSSRGLRGGPWDGGNSSVMSTISRSGYYPDDEFPSTGFRVASTPEPSTAVLAIVAFGAACCWRKRESKRDSLRRSPSHARQPLRAIMLSTMRGKKPLAVASSQARQLGMISWRPSSMARTVALATFSGETGGDSFQGSSPCSSMRCCMNSVSVGPAATTRTSMPSGANSARRASLKPASANLLAQYSLLWGQARLPRIEPMLTTIGVRPF